MSVEWSTDSSHRTTSWQPVMINTGKKVAVRDSSSRLKERESTLPSMISLLKF